MAKKLWMRLGDAGDYEVADDPYSAGYDVGAFYEATGFSGEPEIRWQGKGVSVDPGFTNYNYISLFWGDDDARPVGKAELTASEKAEFKRGLYEGADIKVAPRATKPKSTKRKTKKSGRKSGGTSIMGGIR